VVAYTVFKIVVTDTGWEDLFLPTNILEPTSIQLPHIEQLDDSYHKPINHSPVRRRHCCSKSIHDILKWKGLKLEVVGKYLAKKLGAALVIAENHTAFQLNPPANQRALSCWRR
jgi:hypothetical protein